MNSASPAARLGALDVHHVWSFSLVMRTVCRTGVARTPPLGHGRVSRCVSRRAGVSRRVQASHSGFSRFCSRMTIQSSDPACARAGVKPRARVLCSDARNI